MKSGTIQKQRENSNVSGLTDQKYRHCRLREILLSNFRVYYFSIVLCRSESNCTGGQILATQITT